MGPVFAAVGIGLIIFLVKVEAGTVGLILGCVIGGLFALAGVAAMFYCDELRVDFVRKRYERKKGFVFASKEYSSNLQDFRRVMLKSEVRRSKDSTYILYACSLILEHEGESDKISLSVSKDEVDARSKAEKLARAFNIPLRDETGEQAFERAPDELDLSLRERAAQEGASFEFKELAHPPGRLSQCLTVEGSVLTLVLPRGGFAAAGCFLLAFSLFWNGFVAFAFFMISRQLGEDPNAIFGFLFLSLFALVGIGLFVGALYALRSRARVTLSPERIAVETLFLSRSWRRREARSNEVEEVGVRAELRAGEGPHVYVRTDKTIIKFGSGLKPEELEWLGRLTRGILSA